MSNVLKYEFSQAEAEFLLQTLNRVQFAGVDTAREVLSISSKLQNPLNASELIPQEEKKK